MKQLINKKIVPEIIPKDFGEYHHKSVTLLIKPE